MIKGIHFLLTYTCNYACDHCFLYCCPSSKGTFTLNQIIAVLNEAQKMKTVEFIYFEGGEPFLFYPLMMEGIKEARKRKFKVGIVTNSYWAISVEDAELWLRPFSKLKISDLSVSDDKFHFDADGDSPASIAQKAAQNLGIPAGSICIEKPSVEKTQEKGKPVIGGGTLLKGRAVEKLINGLPRRPWNEMKECPYEDLRELGRIHVDAYGNTQICQGVSIGNFWKTPLAALIKNYDPDNHPICGPLLRGGPAELVKTYNLNHEERYVDECHLCYECRRLLLDSYPDYLTPKQVYGIFE
jgi:hypothetical protein